MSNLPHCCKLVDYFSYVTVGVASSPGDASTIAESEHSLMKSSGNKCIRHARQQVVLLSQLGYLQENTPTEKTYLTLSLRHRRPNCNYRNYCRITVRIKTKQGFPKKKRLKHYSQSVIKKLNLCEGVQKCWLIIPF